MDSSVKIRPNYGLFDPAFFNFSGIKCEIGQMKSCYMTELLSVVDYSLSCVWLCDLVGCSPPGSPVHGVSQARILEWVAVSFSRGSSQASFQTRVFCIGRQILYHGATREAPIRSNYLYHESSFIFLTH